MAEVKEGCAVYARYSSHNQNDASIEQQVAECQAYAAANGLQIVEVYADRAISGTTDKRPEFQRMLADSRSGKWTVLLTWKLDRFARNRYDSATYKFLLKKNGVRVLYVKESIPDGPEGILLESILEGSAEYYSANLAQNVRRGLMANARECKHNGRVPFGYLMGPDGRLMIDEEKTSAVQTIFRRYAGGDAPVQILRDIDAEGFLAPGGDRFAWSNIRRMIRNPAYKGVYRFKDTFVDGGVPAIVDVDTWSRANARMDTARRDGPRQRGSHLFILTGTLKCGVCGRKMSGRSSTKGKTYYYYLCSSNRMPLHCSMGAVNAQRLEDLVIQTTVDQLLAPDVIGWIADRIMDLQAMRDDGGELPKLRAQLAENETAHRNIMKAIEAGVVTRSTKNRLEELEAEGDRIRHAIQIETDSRPQMDRDSILFWFEQFRDGQTDDIVVRKRLIEALISRVEAFPDKVRIVYNCAGSGPDAFLCKRTNPGVFTLKQTDSVTVIVDASGIAIELTARICRNSRR